MNRSDRRGPGEPPTWAPPVMEDDEVVEEIDHSADHSGEPLSGLGDLLGRVALGAAIFFGARVLDQALENVRTGGGDRRPMPWPPVSSPQPRRVIRREVPRRVKAKAPRARPKPKDEPTTPRPAAQPTPPPPGKPPSAASDDAAAARLLRVSIDASEAEINDAYRRLVREKLAAGGFGDAGGDPAETTLVNAARQRMRERARRRMGSAP